MADSSSSSSSAPATVTAPFWTTMLSGKTDADKEEMLDRQLTRLALCDDSKLQDLLSKLLPLSIASLSSPCTPLRNKVIEILSHVNKRVKHQPDIGLPLLELWQLYEESSAFSMVRNFCIVYIEMAIERVRKEEKENMTPTLLASISKVPTQHQEILLRIITKVIGECHSSHLNDEVVATYRKLGGLHDNEIFLEFCLQMILYQPILQSGACPAGLSITQCNRVTGKQQLTSDTLRARKIGILNIVEAMEIAAELVYPLYIAACADSQESVVKKGEELLKKKTSGVNLDDVNLIKKLFLLFNGTTGSEQIPPESKVTPANASLRVRLMSVFCRSISAANSFPSTLQCIFGCIYGNNTTSRLKQLGMEFTVWVFKYATMDQLKLMGPVILTGIYKSLDGYSAPESDAVARDTKAFAFQAVGLIAQRMPQLFRDKIDTAVWLFDALQSEGQFLRLTIQEATNSLAVAYKEQSEVRFCAIRWATILFDMQHCPSRFICMLGAADPKLDIREIALEGLGLDEDQRKAVSQNSNLHYPKLSDMLNYIIAQHPAVLHSTSVGETALLFPSKSYIAMIKFLLKCFVAEEEEYNLHLPEDFEYSCSVDRFCLLLEHAMAYEGSVELHTNASKALITIASSIPQVIATRYADKVSWLKKYLGHIDFDTRESISRLLGIASCALPLDTLSNLVQDLISSVSAAPKLRFEMEHGLLCALGYITANCMSRKPSIPESLLQSVLKCLTDVVNLETPSLASIAMQALGHVGLSVPLPPLLHGSNPVAILTVLNTKLIKLLAGDDIKAVQRIVISLGHLSFKESSSAHLNNALDLIFSLCHSKVEDILFAAGEALAFLWGGVPVTVDMILKTNYTSLSTSSNFLMGNVFSSLPSSINMDYDKSDDVRDIVRDAITRKLFDVLLYSSRKEERCAGTVWLLSLTIYCGHHPTIQKLLPNIQEAFSHLLAEQNELIQELASQGLSIVYEIGDASMKKNLVDALVGTLTGSGKRKRAVKLVEDSEVFQEGLIGESPTGGKLSTYKELCNLANEMGQPDLIYKFMDLANYQSSMHSKRGAAFGFSKIAKYAGDALQPYLRSLIPRLFRYQYDPDKNVQDAMMHIWRSLVADSKKTIDEHLDLIIEDLLVQCGSRLWRSREASCLALSDIIQGRKFDQVKKYLRRIWSAAFRAMDDIKESVRNAGDRLCRAVTSLTQRLCDVSLTEIVDAKLAMDIVLPLLITEGIMSKVENIRKASIGVITKLAKSAGISLRPHLPDLVYCMLESLSSLEDQGLNYVELHAANVGIQTQKLENIRISIAKSSPMWETLERCIDIIDAHSLELLIPRVAQLVRIGVGLNTRVGVASFLSLLVQKVGSDIKPFIPTLLKLLFHAVKDEKSATAKRGFASACATVLKYATPTLAQKLIEDTAALQSGDRSAQISCAILLKSYSSNATDILSGYSAVTVPVIFISRFEDDKTVSGLYEEMWEENMNSERITLQLYLGEIVNFASEGIMSSSWSSKRKAAQAISKLCEVLGDSVSSHHHVLLTSLMKEIPGRLWEGKEALLYALSSLCKSCHEAISAADPDTPTAILNLLSSACTRKASKYREAAFDCLEQVIKAFGILDFFSKVFPLLHEMCCSTTSTGDVKPDEEENWSTGHDKIVNCITAAIHVARLNDILEQQKKLLNVFSISLSASVPWIVKISVFTSIKELCSRLRDAINNAQDSSLQESIISFVHELFFETSSKVLECIRTIKIAQVHISASECLFEIIDLLAGAPAVQLREVGFRSELLQVAEMEKNEQAKSTLKKCIDILKTLEENGRISG
ncbi:PREDICTED: proteasome-associated protein ECM29 homolog isoform X2 [Ipomoea nil]|uniref:proteasome-associated protein ECM29 homolog isoform X2 n=1 Tax=Ipomoea nil TaxID=35883 RepID=UPI0009012FA2|nr:PREDICTED: proteasome-associated protein ECM29 homolog isoform X2 [Ipomoea nil]